ncbi:MAG: 16S rRNA (uracil(1498)-N(3))-methyltransferase [Vicinamibacterales bacterium]
MNLVLIDPAELRDGQHVHLEGDRARHLLTVLNVDAGREVRVGLIDGPLGHAAVVAIAEASVTLRCEFEAVVPERPPVDLLLAVPRPKVMRRLWPQIAALGVGRVILTNAERVERAYFDAHVLHEQHWRPLLLDGLQQARDTRVPQVSIHRRFRVLVEDELGDLSDASQRLVADPASPEGIGTAAASQPDGRVLLSVGPEGGWNDFELQLLRSHGFAAIGLGPRTLRSDTACVALLALVHDRLRVPVPTAAAPNV